MVKRNKRDYGLKYKLISENKKEDKFMKHFFELPVKC